jgi:hypothetical protein
MSEVSNHSFRGIDAYEVLQRIRRARDWARAERDGEGDEARRAVYGIVADVLDEILQPGRHSAPQ